MNRAEMELLELGLLHPAVIPEVTRRPDGLEVGCRYHCPLPPTNDVVTRSGTWPSTASSR